MKAKKSPKSSSNLNLAAFFIVSIFLLIFLSSFIKVFLLYNQSKFDGNTPLNILVYGKEASVLAISPSDKKLSAFLLKEKTSKENISALLGLPFDAEIKSDSFEYSGNVKGRVSALLLNYKDANTDLNLFDRVRLFLFVQGLSKENLSAQAISKNQPISEIDRIITSGASDRKIIDEGLSIEIINASGVDGEGADIARLVTNIGGNVILVSTSQNTLDKSSVEYKREMGYTVNRLSDIFNFEVKKHTGDSIADVIIVLGKDRGVN